MFYNGQCVNPLLTLKTKLVNDLATLLAVVTESLQSVGKKGVGGGGGDTDRRRRSKTPRKDEFTEFSQERGNNYAYHT
jgi:hypothetical protein